MAVVAVSDRGFAMRKTVDAHVMQLELVERFACERLSHAQVSVYDCLGGPAELGRAARLIRGRRSGLMTRTCLSPAAS